MERLNWNNIAEAGQKIASPLKQGRFRWGACALAGIGLILAALPMFDNKPQPPYLMIDAGCDDQSQPLFKVRGNFWVPENETYWLVVSKVDTRNFRVLEGSNGPNWKLSEEYHGFAKPKNIYTDLPVDPFRLTDTGKKYAFRIYSGGYSNRKTPLLAKLIQEIQAYIPICSNADRK